MEMRGKYKSKGRDINFYTEGQGQASDACRNRNTCDEHFSSSSIFHHQIFHLSSSSQCQPM